MAKVKIEAVGAYIDGHAPGSEIEVEEDSAKYLESIGYAKVLGTAKKSAPKRKQTQSKAKQGEAKAEGETK
jgi:hypothetical protein